jgi:anti-repressor protein
MQELIHISDNDGKKAVSAKELYQKLGYDPSQWSRWFNKNIIENQFAVENEDWVGFDMMSKTPDGGRPSKDFALSIDFAKKLAMLARTETGEKIREYFIEKEKEATNKYGLTSPTRKQLAEWVLQQEEQIERLQLTTKIQEKELKESAPKIDYYNEVLTSDSTYTVTQIAKELGMGAITLNQKLKQLGVQYKQSGQWLLSYKYQNKGYTDTRTFPFPKRDGTIGTSMETVWTEKGREFIHWIIKQQKIAV